MTYLETLSITSQREAMTDTTTQDQATSPPVPTPATTPTVRVSVKIAGTRKSGFRFQCGGIDQHSLDITRDFTHDQAKRIAELVVAIVNEK